MAVSLGASRLLPLLFGARLDDEYQTSDEVTVKHTGWIRPRGQLLRRATNGWLGSVGACRLVVCVRLPDD